MEPAEAFDVEVVVAGAGRVTRTRVRVAPGATVAEALDRSRALAHHPELEAVALGYAIFGRVVPPSHVLEPGDRIEVLRPLLYDPRERRRALAREGRSLGRSARGG